MSNSGNFDGYTKQLNNAASALQFEQPDGDLLDEVVEALPDINDGIAFKFIEGVVDELLTRPHQCHPDHIGMFAEGLLTNQRIRFPDSHDKEGYGTTIPDKLVTFLAADKVKEFGLKRFIKDNPRLTNLNCQVSIYRLLKASLITEIGEENAEHRSRFFLSLVLSIHYKDRIKAIKSKIG